MDTQILYYVIMMIALFAIELLYFKIADRLNIIDKPNERSSHKSVTLRGGGIIFYFGALAYFIASGGEYPWFMLGLTMLTAISFVDDIKTLSQGPRLFVQIAAIGLMFYQWTSFLLPWWWLMIALVFCIGIINAYNFMDGINGITGGYSLVVLMAMAYINTYVVAFMEPEMIYTMMIAIGVFNFFNFRKRAKCFAGDVGSVSVAFIVLFLLGKLMLATMDFSWIILLGVYGVDSVLTIVHRIMLKENIGEPHRKHMYQIMANELKMPHVVVASIYMGIQLLLVVGYLYCYDYGYWYLFGAVIALSLVYILFMTKYFHLHTIKD